jgi:hypothetical protein
VANVTERNYCYAAARDLCRRGTYSLTVDSLWSNSYHVFKIRYAPGSYLGPEAEDLKINKCVVSQILLIFNFLNV